MPENILESLKEFTGLSYSVQNKIFLTFFIIFILGFVRFIILKVVWTQTKDTKLRYSWKSAISYLIPFIGIIIIAGIWIRYLLNMGAFLGLLSAGLAIALKDPLSDMAGWLFIISRRPFTLGDRIQIGDNAGDIIDIRFFQFTIMEIGNWVDADQSTGRIIHIPNSKIFTEPQANFSKGFQYIWHEIPILLTFESDWKKGKGILNKIAQKHAEHISKSAEKRIVEASKKYMIHYRYLTPKVYTSVRDSGVLLTIRYLSDPRRRRGTENAIWEDILLEFEKYPEIEFAYPTQRFFDNAVEGPFASKNQGSE
jgi:small-conductance mechanosensitive channel